MTILSALLFAALISIDTLAAGFGYGTSNKKVRWYHTLVINIICSIFVSIALLSGFLLSHYIPPEITHFISVGILILIGSYKFVQSFLQKDTAIDCRQISWLEAITLAIILSLDGIVVGIGVSIYNSSLMFCLTVIAFSLVTDYVFFSTGYHLAKKITKKTRFDLSWLSGVVLIIIGVLKLFV